MECVLERDVRGNFQGVLALTRNNFCSNAQSFPENQERENERDLFL